ncbi:Uma2 family endonuclease [Scytonema sp. UIC 10036]|uniref:Uma2 family endonuclease n=1 Tax=Scytonema sp. UIC 10036 TaxID=2304196 RepID=UPI001FA9E408|nr:Uma2 family endonuclease [Scytonema sp. UIC 10036]
MNLFPASQTDPPLPAWQTLPTMCDLKSEDPEEPGLPDEFHHLQPALLSRSLRLKNYITDRFFTGTNLNLYYDVEQTEWHKRPDWFLAQGVPRLHPEEDLRRSYVVWQEQKSPFVVVELLSPSTEKEDLGVYAESEPDMLLSVQPEVSGKLHSSDSQNGLVKKTTLPSKWEVYEKLLDVPYYIVFSRYTNRVRFFRLMGGQYQEQPLDHENPRIWIAELEIGLGLWHGEFRGITLLWLRWYDADGNWIPTDTEQERAEKEQALEQAEQERTRAEQERIRAEQAAEQLLQVVRNLLEIGMSITQVSQLTGLPEMEVQKLQ